jgi:hypothetical protein
MKIGILIPSTSKGREWKNYKETYFYKITIKTFILSLTETEKKINFIFYIGIDRNDPLLDTEKTKTGINKLKNIFSNIDFQYLYMDNIAKGHLTVMWNRLYKKALEDGCEYFYQCGDDIEFKTKGWVTECIKTLNQNNNVGLVGPINNNNRILTQSFVSRKHYELFECFFPEEIINWCCDDWINEIYRNLNAFYPLKSHFCINIGGEERYTINNDPNYMLNIQNNTIKLREECSQLVKKYLLQLKTKLQNK